MMTPIKLRGTGTYDITSKQQVFLAHFYSAALNAGQSSREKGVSMSVCPSNVWIVAKRKKNIVADFLQVKCNFT